MKDSRSTTSANPVDDTPVAAMPEPTARPASPIAHVTVTLLAVRDGVFGELKLVRDGTGHLGEVFTPDLVGRRVQRGYWVDGVGFVADHPLPMPALLTMLGEG